MPHQWNGVLHFDRDARSAYQRTADLSHGIEPLLTWGDVGFGVLAVALVFVPFVAVAWWVWGR